MATVEPAAQDQEQERNTVRRIVQKRRHLRAACLALMASLGAIALTACGSSTHSSSSSSGSSGSTGSSVGAITIGLSAPVASFALPQMALDLGYFRKNGVAAKVTVKTIPGAQLLSALAGGSVQFGVFASPQPDLGGLAGSLKWVASWASKADLSLLAQPNITLKDLKGKRIGITAAGSSSQLLTSISLSRAGLSTKDVKILPLGAIPSYVSAFVSGQTDAEALAPPLLQTARSARPGSHIIDNYLNVPFTGAGLAANTAFLKKDPGDTVKILRALNQSLHQWLTDATAAKKVIKELAPATKQQDIDAGYSDTQTFFAHTLVPVSETVERNVLKLLQTNGFKQADPGKWSSIVDSSYLMKALAK